MLVSPSRSKKRSRKKKLNRPRLAPLDVLQRYALEEAAEYLRISRSGLYLRIKNAAIATISDGGRRLIPGSEIARLSAVPARPYSYAGATAEREREP